MLSHQKFLFRAVFNVKRCNYYLNNTEPQCEHLRPRFQVLNSDTTMTASQVTGTWHKQLEVASWSQRCTPVKTGPWQSTMSVHFLWAYQEPLLTRYLLLPRRPIRSCPGAFSSLVFLGLPLLVLHNGPPRFDCDSFYWTKWTVAMMRSFSYLRSPVSSRLPIICSGHLASTTIIYDTYICII